MKFISIALLLLNLQQYLSESKSFEIKLGSSYSGSIKSGQDFSYFKLTTNNNAFQSTNIPNNLVYISLTLCSTGNGEVQDPDIYYSLTDSTPGPNRGEKLRNNFTSENFSNWKLTKGGGMPKGILLSTISLKPRTSGGDISLYLGVNLSGKNLEYSYQLGVNTNNYYHNYNTQSGLVLLDTDDTTASFTVISNNPSKFDNNTQALYYHNSGGAGELLFTTCSLQNNTNLINSKGNSDKIKLGGKLPSQFMGTEAIVSGLNRDTSYEAILVNTPTSSGASTFNPPVSFKTSKYSDCKLMNQLKFCDMVSYSVPLPTKFIIKESNSTSVDLEKVKKAYDDYAMGMYEKFQNLIDQYDCEAHIYSPVRTCSDCQAAYKDWLCSMTFPRCADDGSHSKEDSHSSNDSHSNNNSNNIDLHSNTIERDTHDRTKEHLPEDLRGVNSYHEIKPCIDLCYYVVQSCPVAFEFTCPEAKSTLGYTYGVGTMEFVNITNYQPAVGDNLGELPWGCNNMMRSVSNQASPIFKHSYTLLSIILSTLTFIICI